MTACCYPTVLDKPCGRPAVTQVRWETTRPGASRVSLWSLCPFHRDLQLAELVLSCDVDSIAVTNLPTADPAADPTAVPAPPATRMRLVEAIASYVVEAATQYAGSSGSADACHDAIAPAVHGILDLLRDARPRLVDAFTQDSRDCREGPGCAACRSRAEHHADVALAALLETERPS